MYPKQKDIRGPLLDELRKRGGKCRPSDLDQAGKNIYDVLADLFSLSLAERTALRSGQNKWANTVRWAKEDLKRLGLIHSPQLGVWSLVEAKNLFPAKTSVEDRNQTGKVISLESFLAQKLRAAHIGMVGEEYVLQFEQERLNSLPELQSQVRHIALEDVGAGYDIKSYQENGIEKYIEVKTSSSKSLRFFLSSRELHASNVHGSKYWLYLVHFTKQGCSIVKMINDPFRHVKNGEFELIPTEYRVHLNKRWQP